MKHVSLTRCLKWKRKLNRLSLSLSLSNGSPPSHQAKIATPNPPPPSLTLHPPRATPSTVQFTSCHHSSAL